MDVYEYVDGRPQLISSGHRRHGQRFGVSAIGPIPGLVGRQRRRHRRLLRDLRHPGRPGPQRRHRSSSTTPAPAAASRSSPPPPPLRGRGRVPRGGQLAPPAPVRRHRREPRHAGNVRDRRRKQTHKTKRKRPSAGSPAPAEGTTGGGIAMVERTDRRISTTAWLLGPRALSRRLVAIARRPQLRRASPAQRARRSVPFATVRALDHQAGGHPDVTSPTRVSSATTRSSREPPASATTRRTSTSACPPGFIGNPHATPQCTAADFAAERCPADSQVGARSATVDVGRRTAHARTSRSTTSSRRPDQAGSARGSADAGLFDVPLYTVLSAQDRQRLRARREHRTSFSVRSPGPEIPRMTLWGVPADPSHDALRFASNCIDCFTTGHRRRAPGRSNSPLDPVPPESRPPAARPAGSTVDGHSATTAA